MYRILTASKDTYITNKIINNKFRATDANVGEAASIDIFKLYSESTSGSDTTPTEVSRGLIKFDLEPLRKLTGSILDITHSSFQCNLILRDVYGGQTTPSNFKIIVFFSGFLMLIISEITTKYMGEANDQESLYLLMLPIILFTTAYFYLYKKLT